MLGWGEKIQVVGQKAKKHYDKAHNIGQKVSKGYHYAQNLYKEARNLKSAEQAIGFVKREAGKADEYQREASKVLKDARRTAKRSSRLFADMLIDVAQRDDVSVKLRLFRNHRALITEPDCSDTKPLVGRGRLVLSRGRGNKQRRRECSGG